MKISELKKGLDEGDYGEQLLEYGDTAYICDAIGYIADSNTSIYYSDITDFMNGNIDAVNDAIDEFGWDGCGRDLMKAGQMAEYLTIEHDLYEHYDDAIMLYVYDYLQSIGIEELADEQFEELENMDTDHNLMFGQLLDNVNEIMEMKWLGYSVFV